MKTKIEINGYEIEIEEIDGAISVKAELDGEIVEEFTLEPSSQDNEEGDEEEVQSYDEFGDEEEEEDFDEEEESQEMEEEESNEKLESFQSFINKKK
jgi:hypothetical protein